MPAINKQNNIFIKFIHIHAILGIRIKRDSICHHYTCHSNWRSCDFSVIFTPKVKETAVFSARSKDGSASYSCLLYLKNQEEYLLNINTILDDMRQISVALNQNGAQSTEKKNHGNGSCNINLFRSSDIVKATTKSLAYSTFFIFSTYFHSNQWCIP